MTTGHPLSGSVAVLTTRHGKGPLIGPVLTRRVGLCVSELVLDTDVLGTFTGEVPRPGTPEEVVVAKARLGMEATGCPLGIASEGTIGPHPHSPFVICDTEHVVLVDDVRGTVVRGSHVATGIPALSLEVEPGSLDHGLLSRGGFPEHGVIVRPAGGTAPVFKGIHSIAALRRAVEACAEGSETGTVHLESDFRALHHPSRRSTIARAAEDLARRLAALCPGCGTPGWGVARRRPGAHCAACDGPTPLASADVYGCPSCGEEVEVNVAPEDGVDPARCPWCNP